ncbi:ELL domain-containing protein [Trichonephila clavipes]|nr:ELL domain-containing protein [Trichonephila clavipes]
MAALVEGQQYGLSAQDKINCTKSLVFVKLTDSALRSIEEYVKNKGDAISKPTIQFQNSSGVIFVLNYAHSMKDEVRAQYH